MPDRDHRRDVRSPRGTGDVTRREWATGDTARDPAMNRTARDEFDGRDPATDDTARDTSCPEMLGYARICPDMPGYARNMFGYARNMFVICSDMPGYAR